MTTELKIGTDYGSIFGLEAGKGQKMVYLGGIKWRAEKPGAIREIDCQRTTDKVVAYVSKPGVVMGF